MRALPLALLFAATAASQTSTYAVFTSLTPTPQPSDRERACMAHDEARGRTLLAGGWSPGGSLAAGLTWEFDGAVWQAVSPPTQLDFNDPVRLVYSPQRGQIVALTGADTVSSEPMRLWGWTGTNWVSIDANGPPSRADTYEIAWDGQRGVLVMFGSATGAETWEWSATGWALRGTGGPVPREGHRMVYDEARQRVVLYGGRSMQNQFLHDTWEWNGVYWLERFGIPAPATSQRAAIAYDRARQRVVLHGGLATGSLYGDVWEYDGNGWHVVPGSGGPAVIEDVAMAWLPASNRMLLFGGNDLSSFHRTRTITFVTGHVAAAVPHRPGCVGPAGVPTLAAVGGARPVLGAPFALRFTSLPSTPLALVFATLGFDDQTWNGVPLPLDLSPLGFSACPLNVAPGVVEPLANVGGIANWTIGMPATPALDGVVFYLQGLVLTAGFNPGGAVTSSSLRCTAGVL